MSSRSPEPLIDFSEGDDTSSTSSSGSGSNRRRPPPPPKPGKSLSRSTSDVSSNSTSPTKRPLPLPPKKAPPTTPPPTQTSASRPPPPPKPKATISRTVSTPPTARRPPVENRRLPSPPPRSPPSPPPRSPPEPPRSLPSRPLPAPPNSYDPPPRSLPAPPPRSSHPPTQSAPSPPSSSPLPPPTRNLGTERCRSPKSVSPLPTQFIKQTTPISDGELPIETGDEPLDLTPTGPPVIGKLIDLDSPPPTVSAKSSLTSQTSLKRVQPVCLPTPVSRELEYEEKEHPKNAFKKLSQLRETSDLCDCVLVVGETEIKAHRVVLAACSSYFESMFIGEFSEPEGVPVVIEEVDEQALSALVDFAYTSNITLSHGNVYTLFEAADLLEFQGVKNACFRFFKSQMNKTNCIRTWLFAETHNCTELLAASLKYIEVNFLNIVRGQEFLSVEVETVCQILELENIAITCEEQVYEAVIEWINYDIESRRPLAYRVLQNVRFPSMNKDYLIHITDNEPIIRDDPECLQLIITAIQHHMTNVRGTLRKKMNAENSKMLPRAAAMAVEEVELHRSGCSLGVGIMGGSDRPQHVFRQGDKPGIFIRAVMPDGAAAKSGKIKIGDRILAINGSDVSNCTHEMAVKMLVSPGSLLKLLIRHEPPPTGLKELTLVTKPGEGFGFSISGGVNGDPANPFDDTDEGIFVSEIIPGGAASHDGRLSVGTRILQINSVSLLGKTREECVKVIQGILDRMTLLVCDGFDPRAITDRP